MQAAARAGDGGKRALIDVLRADPATCRILDEVIGPAAPAAAPLLPPPRHDGADRPPGAWDNNFPAPPGLPGLDLQAAGRLDVLETTVAELSAVVATLTAENAQLRADLEALRQDVTY